MTLDALDEQSIGEAITDTLEEMIGTPQDLTVVEINGVQYSWDDLNVYELHGGRRRLAELVITELETRGFEIVKKKIK